MICSRLLTALALVLPLSATAAELAYEPVPIYDETARDLLTTVLGKYEIGVTYTATRTGTLTMNGAPLCDYVKVWEQEVLAIQDGVYTVRDTFRDNVNADCTLRQVRLDVDDYTAESWLNFLNRTKTRFGANAITVYVDKDENVFGWSLSPDAIRYDEVTGWAEFLDRFLLMMRREGQTEIAGNLFEFTVEDATYTETR